MICNVDSKVSTARMRRTHWEGKDYAVVPMVMLKEHVLSGNKGPVFYNEKEIAKDPATWNMKPVTVYHPVKKGSATDVVTFDRQGIGMIMNTRFSNGKLKAEAWIDVAKANRVDPRVMEAVNAGQILEVSTGMYADRIDNEGEYNGKKYSHEAINLKPDHLAILPDKEGALSVEDGAGLLRNQQADVTTQESPEDSAIKPLENEESEMAEDAVKPEAVEVEKIVFNSAEDIDRLLEHCEGNFKQYATAAFSMLQNSLDEQISEICENSEFEKEDFVGKSPKEISKLHSLVRNTKAPQEVEVEAEAEAAVEVEVEEVVENEVKPNLKGQAGVAPIENASSDDKKSFDSALVAKPIF